MKSLISCIASVVLLFILNSCNSSKKVTTIDFHDGSYVGEVDGKGLKQGKGTYSWLDGSIYEGDFDKDLRARIGSLYMVKWGNIQGRLPARPTNGSRNLHLAGRFLLWRIFFKWKKARNWNFYLFNWSKIRWRMVWWFKAWSGYTFWRRWTHNQGNLAKW